MAIRSFILNLVFLSVIPAHAFNVRGQVQGLPAGSMVYLWTSPQGMVEHKWKLSLKTDSTRVDSSGVFTFQIPSCAHATLFRVTGAKGSIAFFFSKDEDISISGYQAQYALCAEQINAGRDHRLMDDIMLLMEGTDFQPLQKRWGIEWLKRHASEDVAVWATAYYTLVQPLLDREDVDEIWPFFPPPSRTNPYFSALETWRLRQHSFQDQSDADRTFRLQGFVENYTDGMAQLYELAPDGQLHLCDSIPIVNRQFCFLRTFLHPTLYYIGIKNVYSPLQFMAEPGRIEAYLRVEPVPDEQASRLRGTIYGSVLDADFREATALPDEQAVGTWIAQHPTSWAAFFRAALWTDFASPQSLKYWAQLLEPAFGQYSEYNTMMQNISRKEQVTEGSMAPTFSLADSEGKTIELSVFRGQYLLIDFWASWCGPCRKEIPRFKDIWERYHEKGLQMVSISIDEKPAAWHKALEQETMSWTQLTAAGSDVASDYCVTTIPHTVLIDPSGRILATGLRAEELLQLLQTLIPS